MRTLLHHTLLTLLACLGLPLLTQASDPEGILPNGNTAEGFGVLGHVTTGAENSGLGFQSLLNDTTGNGNSGFGFQSLFNDKSGSFNTAMGFRALFHDTSGMMNVAYGFEALFTNTTAIRNTAVGNGALLHSNASSNTAVGWAASFSNTSGSASTAVGFRALASNMESSNTAVGGEAASSNTTGLETSALGWHALFSNTIGSHNTGLGHKALQANTAGEGNTAVGAEALELNTSGTDNTGFGFNALINSVSGSGNIAIGANAGISVTTASNVVAIGLPGADVSGTCFIRGIRGVTTQNANAVPVLVDSAGQLGTVSSSVRFKKEIKPMDKASEAILALKPVTFHYKSDSTNTPQFGLIAEEVAKVDPDLVVRDDKGEIYSVRYDAVNAMLLNEFLKEHRKAEEQASTIAELKNEVRGLVAQVKEQNAKIQKVTDQVALDKAARRPIASSR